MAAEKNPFAKFLTHFKKGHVLFKEGEDGEDMYIVQSGRVAIKKKMKDGDATLAVLEKGDFFGEMAILERMPRSASAEMVEDGDLIVIAGEIFGDMIKANPEIAVRMLRKQSIRLREANRQIQAFLSHDGAGRALEVLRSMVDEEKDEQGNRRLRLVFSRADVAPRVGLSLSEAEQVVSRLVRAGVLLERQGGLWLADEQTLEDFLLYLELQTTYDPLTTSELAEIAGLPEDEVHRIVRRVLVARLGTGDEADQRIADTYQKYLRLKARFEYAETV